jgi:hypothetical protein
MRWTGSVLAAVVIGVAGPAAGYQPGCAGCNGGMSAGSWAQRGQDAEACASPGGHCFAPGCCEDTRHCCDNAWAGYCDHRAKVDAFWSHVGVPGSCARSRPCRQAIVAPDSPCEPVSTPAIQPTPAVPTRAPAAMPAPPDEAARSVRKARMW